MPTIRRNAPVTGATPSAPPAPTPASPEVEPAKNGWSAPTTTARDTDSTMELRSSAEAAAARLAPSLGPIAPVPMLKALGDGTATVDVPLRAGDYKVNGVPFSVKPGTVARVHVQVKNGELVSVGNGQQGTSLKIDPPLDLPLWITGEGVELKGSDAKQKFEVELGGFFDLSFKAQKLSAMVSGEARDNKLALEMPLAKMVDLSKLKVDARVTLRASEIDVGGAKVKVDPATTFSLKGDARHATFSGHVQLDGFGLDQSGVKLSSNGGGQADLVTSIERSGDAFALDSTLSHVKLSVDRLETSRSSALAAGATDRISVGPTEVHDGSIRLLSRINGTQAPTAGMVSLSLKGSGTINDAHLTVKDTKDTASLDVGGRFSGTVEIGPNGVSVDAALTGAHFDVRDLQQTVKGNQVSIEHAIAQGDVHLRSSAGRLQIDGQVRGLDLVVDDFKGGAKGVTADLGRTRISGSANFHVGSEGVQADGRLRGEAVIDSVSFSSGGNGASVGSSTVEGELTKLDLGKGAPVVKIEKVAASIDIISTSVDVGQTSVRGGGVVKGSGNITLDASGLSLNGASQVSMALTDGRVRSSTVDLKLAKGSTATLQMRDLHLGKTSSVKVGPGTRLDTVLAGGSMVVAGQTVELAKGSRAEFVIKHAEIANGKRDLRGTVKLDARLKSTVPGFIAEGVKVHSTSVDGRVKVSLDDVHLADDRLTLSGASASLDATIGHYTGVKNPGQPGFGSLKDPIDVHSVEDVQKTSAAKLAGVTVPPQGSPIDALKLLRDGKLKLDVPMTGSIKEFGLEVVKMPPGSRLDLSLSVKDGKLVADQSNVSLVGGVRALGVEVVGAHLDAKMHVHVDLKIAGRTFSLPVPGVTIPSDMEGLVALASRNSTSTSGSQLNMFDLSHAQLDVSNATFAKGRVALPGGALDLADGSKLSFHGTPLAGELTGAVALDGVTVARDDVALSGTGGRADLHVGWRRVGDKAIVSGGLSNLSLSTQGVARKADNGDYIQLGSGRLTNGTLSLASEILLDVNGLPRTDVVPVVKDASLSVGNFQGELLGARQSSAQGNAEVGHARIDASMSFNAAQGLTLKAKLDEVDAQVTNVQLQRAGRSVDIERARLLGHSGTIDFSATRVAVDAKQLAWDATIREAAVKTGTTSSKVNQVHISGEGSFNYDSQRDLRIEGKLHVDGRGSASTTVAVVTVDKRKGLVVR